MCPASTCRPDEHWTGETFPRPGGAAFPLTVACTVPSDMTGSTMRTQSVRTKPPRVQTESRKGFGIEMRLTSRVITWVHSQLRYGESSEYPTKAKRSSRKWATTRGPTRLNLR